MSFLGGISLATGALTHKAPVIVSIGGKGVVIQRPQLWLRIDTSAAARTRHGKDSEGLLAGLTTSQVSMLIPLRRTWTARGRSAKPPIGVVGKA